MNKKIKTFSNPEIGDEYKDSNGDSRFVLGTVGRVIFLSEQNKKDIVDYFCTKEELIKYDYTIVQDKPEEEIEELTVAEVCEQLGKQIKIVK